MTTFDWPKWKQRSLNEAVLSITVIEVEETLMAVLVCPRRGIHPYEKQFSESKDVSPEQTTDTQMRWWYPENLPKRQHKKSFLCSLKLLCMRKPTKILVNPAEKFQNRPALQEQAANAEIPGFACIWLFQCRNEELIESNRGERSNRTPADLYYILQFQEFQEQRTSPWKAPSTWEALLCAK